VVSPPCCHRHVEVERRRAKLVHKLEEATVRKNRGIFFLHCRRQLPVQ
jgi:hypothetical protein